MTAKKKLKYGRRLLALLLCAILVPGVLAGCGGRSADSGKDQKSSVNPDTVFEEVASPLEAVLEGTSGEGDAEADTGVDISRAGAGDGKYFVLYATYGENRQYFLCTFDGSGGDARTTEIPIGSESWVDNVSLASGGRLQILCSTYDMEEGEEDGTYSVRLESYQLPDADGEKAKLRFSQVLTAEDDETPESIVSSDDLTAVLSGDRILLYKNDDGSEAGTIPAESRQHYGNRLCLDREGKILLFYRDEKDQPVIRRIDPDAKKLEETGGISGDTNRMQEAASGAGDYDLYLTSNKGVYGVKLDGSEPVLLLDFLASDLAVEDVQSCAALGRDTMLLFHYGYGDEGGPNVTLLHKKDPANVDTRTTIVLGCAYADTGLRKAVTDFNKGDHRCRISLREFEFDEESGTSNLNKALAAGEAPDLMVISGDMPLESYASKGVFEDLEPYYEKDADIAGGDYLDNVRDACRIDGKMYFVTPTIYLVGMMGKKKDFGDARGLTVQALEKLMQEQNISYDTVMGSETRDGVLSYVMYCAQDQYVDWEHRTCSFDSDAFRRLLEFTGKFPKDIDWDKVDWDAEQAAMLAGKQLVKNAYLYDFDSYMEYRYGTVGEEIAFMGYPGGGDNRPAMITETRLAMNHAAADKEACWEFLRTFYLDDYQEKSAEMGFPVSKKALRKMADKAMEKSYYTYTDENGKTVKQEETRALYIGGKEYPLPTASQKDIDFVMQALEAADTTAQVDSQIIKIVTEEAGAFFAGQKSAAEVSDIIQSRVQVYINETK